MSAQNIISRPCKRCISGVEEGVQGPDDTVLQDVRSITAAVHDRGPVHWPRAQDDDNTRQADLPRLAPLPGVPVRGAGLQLPPGGPGPTSAVCHQAAAE